VCRQLRFIGSTFQVVIVGIGALPVLARAGVITLSRRAGHRFTTR
jgi:hypothetical protein